MGNQPTSIGFVEVFRVRRIPGGAPPIHPLMRIPVPWVFVAAYVVGLGLQLAFPTRVPSATPGLCIRAGGIVLLGTGAALAVWCLVIFRSHHTTTIPFGISTKLVTWGPYRFSRNPMYVSLALVYLGEAGLLAQLWPLVTLPPVIAYMNWIVIPYEESRLRVEFGNDYEGYRARVRRWIGRR
jgi:protein-S-isoprenylcysteine O-methyltransferase Ste14